MPALCLVGHNGFTKLRLVNNVVKVELKLELEILKVRRRFVQNMYKFEKRNIF